MNFLKKYDGYWQYAVLGLILCLFFLPREAGRYLPYVAGVGFFGFGVHCLLDLKWRQKHFTLPVEATMVEIQEREDWETVRDADGSTRREKRKNYTYFWEYEVDGRLYKTSLWGIVRSVEIGTKSTIVCDPKNPSQAGYPIGEADYRFVYKLFAFGIGAFLLGFFLFAPISARMRR